MLSKSKPIHELKLPPDSKPIIREVGWHPGLCIAVGSLGMILVFIVILKIMGI